MSAPGSRVFVIARNPESDTKLPYLLRLPIDRGVVLKRGTSGHGPRASTAIRSRKAGPKTPK
jgi:hypothetical protein